ncbi:MAG: hypothetical protein JWR88_2491 [Pseudonocardia sp.]|nr:hypothetical protein [Pseudonocardia sp.]
MSTTAHLPSASEIGDSGSDANPDLVADLVAHAIPRPESGQVSAASVRPYVLTGGRTRCHAELGLETLVSTRPFMAVMPRLIGREHEAVVRLCVQPRSLAEVAAYLAVPLGVARVLIGDLVELSALVVHHGTEPRDTPPSGLVLSRVLDGLRRLG